MASSLAAAQLKAAGFEVELDIEPAVGHTISSTVAQKALAFPEDFRPRMETVDQRGRFHSMSDDKRQPFPRDVSERPVESFRFAPTGNLHELKSSRDLIGNEVRILAFLCGHR